MLALRRPITALESALTSMSLRRSTRAKAVAGVGDGDAGVGATPVVNGAAKGKEKVKTTAKTTAATAAKKAKGGKAVVAAETKDESEMPPPPTTPSRKRKHADVTTPSKPPPLTPTPSGVGVMTNSSSFDEDGGSISKVPRVRPAGHHMTNAPLQTPRGSRVVADPLAAAAGEADITTDNLLEKANAHLVAVDSKLERVVSQNHCRIFSPEGLRESIDPFRALVSGICGQQVSGAAAKSIKNKFVALYNEGVDDAAHHVWPTPEQVAATELTRLRTAGLSGRKSEYIQGLAQKFADGELSAQLLAEGTDEELLEKLVSVRGLGRWSAEMFLTFCLKRTDILSTGDLGVQRGMAAYVGRDVAKLKAKGGGKWKYMSEKDMLDISAKFSPYRSLFMWYMWRIEDVNVDAIQDA